MSGKLFHKRVLFLGGESSGKSTITIAAAKATDCFYAHEYGRQFYEEQPGKAFEYEDLSVIATKQFNLELDVLTKSETKDMRKEFSFYDTSHLVTYFYSMEWFGKADICLKIYTESLLDSYEYVFLCENDFPYVQDGSRQSPEFSKKQFDFYKFVLDRRGIPYTILTGTVEERLNKVISTIGASNVRSQTSVGES